MLGAYASAILICLASLVVGRGLLAALGRRGWTWLEGAVGLAVLMVVAQLTVRLPGRGAAALVAIALLVAASLAFLVATRGARPSASHLAAGVPPALIVLLAVGVPFALNDHSGVLGEGVYSNDQAVHLYWADWLQSGVGPRPEGIGWGYPVGPHSLVAAIGTLTGAELEDAFNGFLFALPVLTALIALAVLGSLPPVRRAIAASLAGLPYLVASFLAQSSFKEMTVALLLVAFAVALALLSGEGRARPPAGEGGAPPAGESDRLRPIGVALIVLPIGAVVALSLPGLVWFVLAAAIWLVVELAIGRVPFSAAALAARLRRLWPLMAGAGVILAVLVVLEFDSVRDFVDRVDEVQESSGRLLEREPPWQVFGVWPEGDFRFPAHAVSGVLPAAGLGAVAAGLAFVWWLRRRELAVPAALAGAAVVYAYTLLFGGIHVEAKALAVAAPLLMLLVVRALLAPVDPEREGPAPAAASVARLALGAVFVVAAAGSTFLALRQTPVGSTAHAGELEALRDEVEGSTVAFLGLDRFAPYRLRGAELVQSPGGYIPEPLHARPGKEWEQSEAIDFDTLPSGRLDRFDYAITTAAAYQSSAPENWREVARTDNFILWRRRGEAQPRKVLPHERAKPGEVLTCADPLASEAGTAGVLEDPVVLPRDEWRPDPELLAPGTATAEPLLPPGAWALSLQYNSEVDLTLRASGTEVELPATLDGMYGFAPGEGPYWPVGAIATAGGTTRIEVEAEEPSALERLVRTERRIWLGKLAVTPVGGPLSEGGGAATIVVGEPGPSIAKKVPLADACGSYVDWYQLEP